MLTYREVLQHRKPSSGDGEPASKKTKIEPAETVVVKKVRLLGDMLDRASQLD